MTSSPNVADPAHRLGQPTGSAPEHDDDHLGTAATRDRPEILSAGRWTFSWPALAAQVNRQHVIASVLFVVCTLVLFRLSLFEGWTFVGDSDRLNTALNVRLFEVDALRTRGSIPTWSDGQFMGYSIIGLHWLLTAYTPVPYILALLPPSQLYDALTVLAATLLVLAIGAAYWSFGAYSRDPVSRAVGALLYGLGSYTIHKLTQLDIAFIALVISPIFLRLIRNLDRRTALRSFALITLGWASLVLLTVLQEIAYIGILAGTYALYRSIRTRMILPVLVAGLAFACGTLIGMPRVLTVAAEMPLVARTSNNIETQAVESLRYFGDGLLGRDSREQRLVRGNAVNLHEGIQLLHSTLAALAAIVVGLLARSWVWRTWGVALAMILSLATPAWFEAPYKAGNVVFRALPFHISDPLRVVLVNALIFGVPLWLASWWIARWIARQPSNENGVRETPTSDTPAAVADGPFFFAFVVIGLTVILIPEARTMFWYAFMQMDLMHSRMSVALTVPLAILATILVSRFISGPVAPTWRSRLVIGLAIGVALWAVREALVLLVIFPAGGDVLNILRPRRLVTVEAARLLTSGLLLLVGVVLLARRVRMQTLTLVGGVLAAWMALETIYSADYKLNSAEVTEQALPFHSLNYMQTPPGLFNAPTPEQRQIVRDRVEADDYRVVLIQNAERFHAHPEPHLATFWNLRLVEGYSTGTPKRLAALPWDKSLYSSHFLDIDARHTIPWRVLAALNVKYAIVVDRSFWYNPAPGSKERPLDIGRLEVLENPHPVTPRVFFTAVVGPADATTLFPGDEGVRPPAEDAYVGNPALFSVAEGLPAERAFSTVGTFDPVFDGDRVMVRVDAAAEDRFLVLNEMPHPGWSAWVDGQPTTLYPTNLVMRGILVPAGATTVELRYLPFLTTPGGIGLLVAALALSVVTGAVIHWMLRIRRPVLDGETPARSPQPDGSSPTPA